MANVPKLTPKEVRMYVYDFAPQNYLIDGEEFSDEYINFCLEMAVEEYNSVPPLSALNPYTFPSKSILLWGTLWKMFSGKAAHLMRNTMSYTDGGLQVPIEERAEMYLSMAGQYQQQFNQAARVLKTQQNMEAGWGSTSSDAANFPMW